MEALAEFLGWLGLAAGACLIFAAFAAALGG